MPALLFSCEYATCAVPEAYREIFRGAEDEVASPAGWDPGALNLAQGFSMKFRTPLVHGQRTRLLIDLDASGEARWSRFAMAIPEAGRLKLVEREEMAYRASLRQRIEDDLRRQLATLHVMVRTMDGQEGQVILETFAAGGLGENLATAWRDALLPLGLDVSHRKGVLDSALAADLGGQFPAERYGLLRLKVAQAFFLEGRPWRWETLKKSLFESLAAVCVEK
ncbi:MAG: hypothetical protein DVB25_08150 [Verrucomicrobia bacterium]|nr:MAG: hypothetical protein DVB25_08150 [Verrucomicrobiota bacterium]